MRLAVFGLGFMGSTHIKALQGVPAAELFAVVSDDPVKLGGDLSAISGNLGGESQSFDFSKVRKYRRIEDAIADREIDAVDLCLPTYLHAPTAIAALEAGKHVLVEKPMALDEHEARRMIDAARDAGRVLMVAQVLRFWPDYVALADLYRSGALGGIRSAFFRRRCAAPAWGKWLPDASKSGGGVFDLLIHDVDFCIHLFGEPRSVSAIGHEDLAGGLDVIHAALEYDGLGPVIVTGGWHHPKVYPFSMEYTVSGDRATLEFSSAGRRVTLYKSDGTSEEPALAASDGFQGELAYFAECASANRAPALCPPEQSAAAVRVTRRMLESRQRKGESIPCR
jgi:predicted dehydrogenase